MNVDNGPLVLAGCYGTLGLESGGVADTQLSASSVWEWSNGIGEHNVWAPSGARLKRPGLPWAPSHSNQQQWLQVDLKREKRITGTQLHTFTQILRFQVDWQNVWHRYVEEIDDSESYSAVTLIISLFVFLTLFVYRTEQILIKFSAKVLSLPI